jgi:hydrogenase/urease accessory protein HupE
LNEIDFAPGNRWEATYVVGSTTENGGGADGLLLTSQDPVEIRPATASAAHDEPRLDQWALAGAYLRHGVMHILTGYDHLLFMAALVLAVVTFVDLIKVVTAFTVAHTITLTLSVLNVVRLSSQIVEPMIAASIVVVALQNILWPERSRGAGRLAIAFGFGLFHGLGFAGGLLEAMEGLPGVAVATAIAAFSVGVELGHQAVVLPIFTALKLWRPRDTSVTGKARLTHPALRLGSGAICLAGVVYFVAALR